MIREDEFVHSFNRNAVKWSDNIGTIVTDNTEGNYDNENDEEDEDE